MFYLASPEDCRPLPPGILEGQRDCAKKNSPGVPASFNVWSFLRKLVAQHEVPSRALGSTLKYPMRFTRLICCFCHKPRLGYMLNTYSHYWCYLVLQRSGESLYHNEALEGVSWVLEKIPAAAGWSSGTEFKGAVQKLLGMTWCAQKPGYHEVFNYTWSKQLFGHQYAAELVQPETHCHEWVQQLCRPSMVKSLGWLVKSHSGHQQKTASTRRSTSLNVKWNSMRRNNNAVYRNSSI